jgi:response regulator RpfG family c-di-GMP phosphodiesterase
MMLTGNADLEALIHLVNESGIFRVLTKPCTAEVLSKALRDALAQYHLVINERELLNRTLKGSIKILVDLLAVLAPDAFKRRNVLRSRIDVLSKHLGLTKTWELHVAAMLSPIGLVTLPPEITQKLQGGMALDEIEQATVERVPEIGRNLLINIPRLHEVAQIVYFQEKRFDGLSFPDELVSGESIPAGSRVLKVLNDLARLEERGRTTMDALVVMQGCDGWYDPKIIAAACECFGQTPAAHARLPDFVAAITIKELQLGHVLHADLETNDGQVVANAGQKVTATILECVYDLEKLNAVRLPILVAKR